MAIFSLLLLCFLCVAPIVSVKEGDRCKLLSNGQEGKCISLLRCPAVLHHFYKQEYPQTCGLTSTAHLVCCSQSLLKASTTPRQKSITSVTKHGIELAPEKNSRKTNTVGYKSYQKCLEYSNLVKEFEKPPILFIDKEEEEIDTCGFKVVPLIIGGEEADRREFPHMALVGFESPEGIQWLCGGSIISETYILTAGHCLYSRDFGNATHARMGVTKIEDPDHRQDRKIIDIIRYPQYEPPSYYNDVGLLKLEAKINFDRYARPACLYHGFENSNGGKAVATGWGSEAHDSFEINSPKLMKVTLPLLETKICNDSFNSLPSQRLENGIVGTTQICAGSIGKDTCPGDSGGPLQIYSKLKCMYEIIGVTSFGKACGVGKSPGIYTRVSYYIQWLEETVWS